MTMTFASLAHEPTLPELTGRDGLRLALRREAGEYVLRIARDGGQREERYESRDDAWTRVAALRGVQ